MAGTGTRHHALSTSELALLLLGSTRPTPSDSLESRTDEEMDELDEDHEEEAADSGGMAA